MYDEDPRERGNRWATRGLRPGTKIYAQRAGRLCYGHLAGRLGVALTAALLENGFIACDVADDRGVRRTTLGLAVPKLTARHTMTAAGRRLFEDLGIDPTAAHAAGWPMVAPCTDWTERVPHFAGTAGKAFAAALLEHALIERADVPRAVRLTSAGRGFVTGTLGASLPQG